ncbi:MAG: hypothetical protein EA342_12825 [Leptolyngbya sp. LCM1.Bin17]|jgi:hypothetical protein|nr:MAG: hypothetical protein EA342_12825 [Leptolyngbya sp. LCM1.Bin17]
MDTIVQLLVKSTVALTQLIQPILVPMCFVLAWLLVGLVAWNLIAAIRDGVNRATVMHKIPCANCRYFTNSAFLKCPLHPKTALSEAAIDCADFETSNLMEGH